MRKTTKSGFSSVVVAGVLGAVLLPAASASATEGLACPEGTDTITAAASATEGFACPTGTDTIAVPYAWSVDNVPSLAGTVCVQGGTTLLSSYDMNKPWKATVKSTGASSKGLSIVFKNAQTKQKITLVYASGKTVIK